ncbi:histidinol-phosphate transaminase [Anoxynatronum buryatiense]|uniref:Histidinol-phosphate aminotransferase n=1 Tax=Anoxynatronum buryatiense TaxID=489973 RepID=A0AA46AIY3_9CLOT|nr:histidinol-phosphate transaminase [Anoxynatronum buryatiense]SMP55033.1 histidinol phosphate aminotransferase apoenzyme [Anoxynatronum buryatiense]
MMKNTTDQQTQAAKQLFSMLKKSVRTLNPYHVEPDMPRIKLDANENNWLAGRFQPILKERLENLPIHQYPDSDCLALREKLAALHGVGQEQVITGVGSDQIISWLIQAFVEAGDQVLVMDPTFSMYEIDTLMAGGEPVRVPLGEGFVFQPEPFLEKARDTMPKVVFLTNPNNPTGGVIAPEVLRPLLASLSTLNCVIAVDEAYYEFYGETVADLIDIYPQLIVLRTLSKAYGLAGVRAGYALASEAMMDALCRVKPPYHMSGLDQMAALICLEEAEALQPVLQEVIRWRETIEKEMQALAFQVGPDRLRIFPSQANFLLIRTPLAAKIDQRLRENGIVVRGYGESGALANCLRITVGTDNENEELLEVIRDVFRASAEKPAATAD